MQLIITCPQCRRQYDGTGQPVGARYRCPCGAALEVPRPQPHEAAVIRCSSCGAPREAAATASAVVACRYCGADFTLREQQLDAVCPQCLARVSSRAHHCHSCGTRVQMRTGVTATELPCPACAGSRKLARRQLGETDAAIFDCEVCGGIWVEKQVFDVLADRARTDTLPDLSLRPAAGRPAPAAPGQGPFYRSCAQCGARMNRRNWGQKSGVIVDVCQNHGVWFDLDELDRLLRWLRTGGAVHTEKAAEAERAAVRSLAISGALRNLDPERGKTSLLGELAAGMLGGRLTDLFE
jgi:Zn-finger nucleic acid-binding protein/DNA-directed RNA polymerase subunit RPC12/RpoP